MDLQFRDNDDPCMCKFYQCRRIIKLENYFKIRNEDSKKQNSNENKFEGINIPHISY